MGELKTRPTTASVPEFPALQPDARRTDCEAVAAMMEAATGERAARRKTGKSRLYLKTLADVDPEVLKQIIEGSVNAMEPQRIR